MMHDYNCTRFRQSTCLTEAAARRDIFSS